MFLQSNHDLVIVLVAAAFILLVLAILGGVIASRQAFQVRQSKAQLFDAERKIDMLERRMVNVLNAVPVALVETDITGKFTFANRVAQQLFGRGDDELLGLSFHSATLGVTDPEGRAIPTDLLPIARALRGEAVKGFRHLMIRYGTQTQVLVSVTAMPVMNTIGEVIGASATLVEVQRAQDENSLEGTVRGFGFDAAPLPVWALDVGGRIVDVNAAACHAFGLTRDHMLGERWANAFVSAADFQTAITYLAQIADEDAPRTGTPLNLHLRSPRDGHETQFQLAAWRAGSREGGEHGLMVMALPVPFSPTSVGISADRLEAALERARAEAVAEVHQELQTLSQALTGSEARHREAIAALKAMLSEHVYGWYDAPAALHDNDPALTAENAELKARLATLEHDLDVVRATRNDLQVQVNTLVAAQSVKPAPQPDPRVPVLEAEMAESRALLAALEKHYIALSQSPDTAETENLKDRLNAAEAQTAMLQSQLNAAQTRLDQASEALKQAQKYETVGRLTHSVAQDFAQMLSVINRALEVLARQSNSPENLRRLSEAALAASRRGERLTRQLQAFQSDEF